MTTRKPRTIGELRRSAHKVLSVKAEMRRNLIDKMKKGEELFPGIIGYEASVIPQVENAIIAGQDIIFLGERGQAKTRIIRNLSRLLDDEIPAVAGCEINDNPYRPICKRCRDLLDEVGDDADLVWVSRDERYSEKLATPDITIADLIGEVDPIRVAEGRYLSDELTIHYGLIPRTNRGIFCINELPDLAERIQVGLFNILEERDVQVRGYRIRLPLDVYIVATANPEDYTNRGRIITPLKDRYGAEIRTHYPKSIDHEIEIAERERLVFEDDAYKPTTPRYIKEIVGELTALARRSPDINQRSGVSVRVSIANYETLVSSAVRRAIRLGEKEAAPRISDLPYLMASTAGKIELESVDEGEERIVERLTQAAVLNVFNRYFTAQYFEPLVARFQAGFAMEAGEAVPSVEYVRRAKDVGNLLEAVNKLEGNENPAAFASAVEFILEGLHLNKRLNKDKLAGRAQYRGRP